MKFGVIGLGNIAQKAYLPTYAKVRNHGEFIFATRNEATRQKVQEIYGFTQMRESLEDLIVSGIDACFIHAATQAHYQLAKACLEKGIHVFMDKPVSERLSEVRELQTLAAEKQCIFMIGFNRRFAPMVDHLKQLPEKRVIQLQKNRINAPQPTVFAIYDLFLHLVDTGVYLLEDHIHVVESRIIEKAGNIELAYLHLATPTASAMLTMDFRSGANTEIYQATSPEKTLFLHDLTELEILSAKDKKIVSFNDWDTTLFKRGFEQMVLAFIDACKTKEISQLKQENVLLSHQLCDEMIKKQLQRVL